MEVWEIIVYIFFYIFVIDVSVDTIENQFNFNTHFYVPTIYRQYTM